LQYVVGLAQLGHDVYFLEDSDEYPSCYNPVSNTTEIDPTYGLQFAARVFGRAGLAERWAYYDTHTSCWLGPCANKIVDICTTADLLLNLSGVNPLRPWTAKIPARAFVDTDPAFTQIRHLTDQKALALASRHTAFFSFGENIHRGTSAVPHDKFPWQPTRQPVVLDAWAFTPGVPDGLFTTVMQWDSYQMHHYEGTLYGMKSISFGPYLDLPSQAGRHFELALGSPSAPRSTLLRKGWLLRDSFNVTRDPWTYQRYIRQSKAEFSLAKHGYVVSQSGWFSERSAAYLASGRPVLVQDTGFSQWLGGGAGAVPFTNLEEAVAGIEAINSRYEFHCQAARAVAEEYFDARVVLPYLIERAMS
jgi:hypothetical protein